MPNGERNGEYKVRLGHLWVYSAVLKPAKPTKALLAARAAYAQAQEECSKKNRTLGHYIDASKVQKLLLAADVDTQQKIADLANQLLPALGEVFPELNS